VPSPVAHVGIALAVYAAVAPLGAERRTTLRDAVAVTFAAVLPDFDLLPDVLSGDGIHWHRGPMHSLCFALVAAAVLVAGLRRARPPIGLATSVAVLVAILLHAPLDYTTGAMGAPTKYGVEWFWPLWDTRYISDDPFFGAYHIDSDEGLTAMFAADALPNYLREVGAVVAAALVAAGARALRRRAGLTGT
jgi:hypothetical protein